MKLFLILSIFIQARIGFGGVLLIPDSKISYDTYLERCLEKNYVCTLDFFLSLINIHQTPLFDSLIDSIDLNSLKFIHEFEKKLIFILNNEDLNKNQLVMILKLIDQLTIYYSSPQLKIIEEELLKIKSIINATVQTNQEEFIYIFKSIVPVSQIQKIKTSFIKIPIYFLNYSSAPYKTDSSSLRKINKKPLLAPYCGHSQLKYKIKFLKYCVK